MYSDDCNKKQRMFQNSKCPLPYNACHIFVPFTTGNSKKKLNFFIYFFSESSKCVQIQELWAQTEKNSQWSSETASHRQQNSNPVQNRMKSHAIENINKQKIAYQSIEWIIVFAVSLVTYKNFFTSELN